MLRRIQVPGQWRSLDKDFWPESIPAGCRTIVYGHNGSGKSTISELLLSITEGSSATDFVWEDENKQRTSVPKGGAGPSPSIEVFTRKWVSENLSGFLDGESASAIVTLGKEAIDAKEEEARLATEIARLQKEAHVAERELKESDRKAAKLTREVQDRIVSELREFDYQYFTKNRFSIPTVQDLLRSYDGEVPDANEHAEALKRLGESAPELIRELPEPPRDLADGLSVLPALLTETPTRVAIQALDGDASAQTWVEQGIDLHDGREHCLFCAGKLGEVRRDQLARHFDESWLHIRNQAKTLAGTVARKKDALVAWHAALPAPSEFYGDLRPAYETAAALCSAAIARRTTGLDTIHEVLNTKAADPSSIPEEPDWSDLSLRMSITQLEQVVEKHNDRVRTHGDATAALKQRVIKHLVGSQHEVFLGLEKHSTELAEQCARNKKESTEASRQLDEVRQAQFTTKDMADTLTRDLTRVYGKDHLSVTVTADGKSYACRRGDKPGTDLSEGEQTTLSLLYFLRKLQDQQTAPGLATSRIIVIDDPSSSLDRESLFATHQWLIDTLKGFGQYVILTHDFSLLRLFIKSHKSAWGTSLNKIKKNDLDEIRFPKVAFLEMYASAVHGKRESKIGKLPRVLLNNTSEYAYLFSMVMAGIADPEDHERLFLLPNAARRVLEVFASYKAPHRTDFMQQLQALVEAQQDEPFRDVYDFCNRFSHGEGGESVDVLDARAVHGQIVRCMEFLRAVDNEHFSRMCVATDIEPDAIFARHGRARSAVNG